MVFVPAVNAAPAPKAVASVPEAVAVLLRNWQLVIVESGPAPPLPFLNPPPVQLVPLLTHELLETVTPVMFNEPSALIPPPPEALLSVIILLVTVNGPIAAMPPPRSALVSPAWLPCRTVTSLSIRVGIPLPATSGSTRAVAVPGVAAA